MSDEKHAAPTPGERYFDSEDVEYEVAEVNGSEDDGGETWNIVDEDGDEAVIKWNSESERWEVDA